MRPAAACVGIVDRVDPGVVPGGDRIAVVEPPGATRQRAELDRAVAVDTRAGRLPRLIRVKEWLQHASPELTLEVEDVEGDAELAGDAPGVLRGVQRAAALLELAVAVGDVVQAHPDADGLDALVVEQRRRDRRIDAAGHRHQDPPFACRRPSGVARRGRCEDHLGAQTPISWPRGSAAIALEPERSRATIAGTTSAARSTSASVVVRPRLNRSAPRASSSG